MKKQIYIILFVILYIIVAFSSFFHSIEFFSLANQPWMGVILALAFEIGQAAVLLAILTTEEKNKITAWILMFILTLVQIIGNIYSSYKYILTNSAENLRFFKEPIFIWTNLPDNQTTVIVTYITSAILPLCALLLTAMVTGFLNKDEKKVEENPEEKKEEKEEPKITINEETKSETPIEKPIIEEVPKKDKIKKEYITPEVKEIIDDKPYPTSEEIKKIISEGMGTDSGKEIGSSIIGKEGEDGLKVLEELKKEEQDKEKNEESDEEPSAEFAHEIINEENKKPAHFINI